MVGNRILHVSFFEQTAQVSYLYRLENQTWKAQKLILPEYATGYLDFIDGDVGFAVCSDDQGISSLYKSEDAGVHWSEINSAMIRGLKELKFYSEQDGWGFTDEGLYKTHDGGRTWEEVMI